MNNPPYGLQFSIFTNELKLERVYRMMQRPVELCIDDIPTLRFAVQQYGGL